MNSCSCAKWSCEICFPEESDVFWTEEKKEILNDIKVEKIPIDDFFIVSKKKAVKKVLQNIIINCNCCSSDFCFSVEQQRKYALKAWNQPKRCKRCQDVRRVQS